MFCRHLRLTPMLLQKFRTRELEFNLAIMVLCHAISSQVKSSIAQFKNTLILEPRVRLLLRATFVETASVTLDGCYYQRPLSIRSKHR